MASPEPDVPFSVSVPVVAEWRESNVRCLGFGSQSLTLELHIDATERQASLKLRLPLALADYRKKRNVYLLVSLEHVLGVRENDGPIPDRVRDDLIKNKGTSDILSICFELNQHSVLIAQSGTTIRPKRGPSEAALEALHSLTRTTSFVLYLSRDGLHERQLQSLYTLDDAFTLTTGELESLYGGKGATVLPQPETTAESPPSYDELAPSPPPPPALPLSSEPSGPPVKKRKRSPGPADSKDPAWRTSIQQRLDALTQMVGAVRKEIASAAAPAPETQDLTSHVNELAAEIGVLREQVGRMEERLEKKLESRLAEATEEMLERVERRLEKQREEVADDVDDKLYLRDQEWEARLDDTLLDMKEEAFLRVNEEMQTVEDSIRDDLRRALS
ncbi:hypothetical protein SLS57_009063 [Botryosphaeria dothidea]